MDCDIRIINSTPAVGTALIMMPPAAAPVIPLLWIVTSALSPLLWVSAPFSWRPATATPAIGTCLGQSLLLQLPAHACLYMPNHTFFVTPMQVEKVFYLTYL